MVTTPPLQRKALARIEMIPFSEIVIRAVRVLCDPAIVNSTDF
jgi:hypothetical protein